MVATGPLAVCIFDRSPRRPASTESRWMHTDVLEAEDSEGRVDPFRLQVKLPQVGENPTGFVAAFDAVSFVVTRDCGPHPVVASTCETEEPLFHVPPSAHCLMAFRVSEAKVIRRPRLGVDCVVPGRALGVQGPGETVVRLPARKDDPPRGADAAALQPAPADRGGGSLEQRLPPRPGGGRGDGHCRTRLARVPEIRRRIRSYQRQRHWQTPSADWPLLGA